jgi:hypothetical protein
MKDNGNAIIISYVVLVLSFPSVLVRFDLFVHHFLLMMLLVLLIEQPTGRLPSSSFILSKRMIESADNEFAGNCCIVQQLLYDRVVGSSFATNETDTTVEEGA